MHEGRDLTFNSARLPEYRLIMCVMCRLMMRSCLFLGCSLSVLSLGNILQYIVSVSKSAHMKYRCSTEISQLVPSSFYYCINRSFDCNLRHGECTQLQIHVQGAAATWEKLPGWNACSKACGCVGNCHDVPGFKYKGKQDNADACEKICSSDPSNCDIWIYSSGSKNCWWRTDVSF